MTIEQLLLIIVCSATMHLVMACVMGIYARHKVQYLSLMWLNLIFGAALLCISFFTPVIATARPVIMHPLMLLTLACISFLQSIYPLSVPMPGFLQWGRMLRYASPAIMLAILYFVLSIFFNDEGVVLYTIDDLATHFYRWDVLLRVASTMLSAYYIVNIFRLPRVMARSANVPNYLLGYCSALGLVMVYFLFVSVFYSSHLVGIYVVLFSMLNLYLSLRILEEMASHLPKPEIGEVSNSEEPELTEEPEMDDFNAANQHRYNRVQRWMQTHKEIWCESDFCRDRLCSEVGYNRHLLLQSLRSQGFNNVHDYIVSYRIEELKRLVARGEITTPADCTMVGFGTVITARSCFMKMEGISLDDYLAQNAKKEDSSAK